jgi:hypothetical protein
MLFLLFFCVDSSLISGVKNGIDSYMVC